MQPGTKHDRQGTEEITRDRWESLFAEITRDYHGAHARLEVLGGDFGPQVETSKRTFEGISADTKDGEEIVWLSFGLSAQDHLTHGVRQVAKIWLRTNQGKTDSALELVSKDGTRTLLELKQLPLL